MFKNKWILTEYRRYIKNYMVLEAAWSLNIAQVGFQQFPLSVQLFAE
jgi:hypothetical protein